MRNLFKQLVLLFVSVLLLVSCSDDATDLCKYPAKIIGESENVNNKTKELFLNFDYPYGIYPVLCYMDCIEDPLETRSLVDDIFEELADNENEYPYFEDIGVLFVVTRNPELIQVRVGDKYRMYCNLTGITTGVDYLNLQLNISESGVDKTLSQFLMYISQRVTEYNDLPARHKGRLNGMLQTTHEVLDYIGTPSENLYCKIVLKPILKVLSGVYKIIGNWFWSIFIIISIVFFIRLGVDKSVSKLSSRYPTLHLILRLILNLLLGLLFPITVAGAAFILSKGRLEDYIALQSLGIPFVEEIAADPTNFVKSDSLLLIVLFTVLWTLKLCVNDNFFYSIFPSEMQKRIYLGLNDFQKGWLQVSEESESPFTEFVISKMIPDLCINIITLSMAAYFFLPRVLLWIGIAIALYSVTKNIYTYVQIIRKNISKIEVKREIIVRLSINLGIIILFSLFMWLLTPKTNPMPLKEEVNYSNIKQDVVDPSILEGNYTFKTESDDCVAYSSAIITNTYANVYTLQINTQTADPLFYTLKYNPQEFLFYSDEIGEGTIHYNKELMTIKIIFTINQYTKWELSK